MSLSLITGDINFDQLVKGVLPVELCPTPKKIYTLKFYPKPVNVTLFGNGILIDVIELR